jgi:acetyltransferase-like isoleucine patch superfamily enzyme
LRWDNRTVAGLNPSDRAPNLLIGARVQIADDVEIGANVILHDDVTVSAGAQLDHGAVLGRPARRSHGSRTPAAESGPTVLGEGAIVSPYALISADVQMGRHSFLGDHAHLREGVRLGAEAMVGAACGIGRHVEIGDRARLQNRCLVGPGSVVESDCFLGPGVQVLTGRTMGASPRKPPPRLRRRCQIGAGVTILPGVEIGEEAVVGAGAVVVADVPEGVMVRGIPARAE